MHVTHQNLPHRRSKRGHKNSLSHFRSKINDPTSRQCLYRLTPHRNRSRRHYEKLYIQVSVFRQKLFICLNKWKTVYHFSLMKNTKVQLRRNILLITLLRKRTRSNRLLSLVGVCLTQIWCEKQITNRFGTLAKIKEHFRKAGCHM